MKKSLDRTFLNYGIRQEDMQLIELSLIHI